MKFALPLVAATAAASLCPAFSAVALAGDCYDSATTTVAINQCAAAEYRAADDALNAAWPVALADLRTVDESHARWGGVPADVPKAVDLLVTAQRAWIGHRDADCAASAARYAGGTAHTAVLLQCKASKTRARTEEIIRGTALSDVDLPPPASDAAYDALTRSLPECSDQGSTVTWKLCVGAVADAADADLNAAYKDAKAAVADAAAGADLVKAQRAWITIRDADCDAFNRGSWGGTGHSGFTAMCHAFKSLDRAAELRARYALP